MIENTTLEQVKSIPIKDIANCLGISIVRNKAFCFGRHDERTLSLTLEPVKNLWHCFGCGTGGVEITIKSNDDFEKAKPFIVRAYDGVG